MLRDYIKELYAMLKLFGDSGETDSSDETGSIDSSFTTISSYVQRCQRHFEARISIFPYGMGRGKTVLVPKDATNNEKKFGHSKKLKLK